MLLSNITPGVHNSGCIQEVPIQISINTINIIFFFFIIYVLNQGTLNLSLCHLSSTLMTLIEHLVQNILYIKFSLTLHQTNLNLI